MSKHRRANGTNTPQANQRDAIEAHIEQLSRAPFQQCLTDLMEAKPAIEDLKKFSSKSSDRWSQAAAIMGRLSGYTEKLQVDVNANVNLWIQQASDQELLAKLQRLRSAIDVSPDTPYKPDEGNGKGLKNHQWTTLRRFCPVCTL